MQDKWGMAGAKNLGLALAVTQGSLTGVCCGIFTWSGMT